MKNKLIIGGTVVFLLGAFLAWLFIASSEPLPGQKMADLGRGHVPIGENVEYNSNPPTSGKHYEDWIRSGVYETPNDDRNLVHSLEHGYVIMSYKCDLSQTVATPSASLCDLRKNQLAKIYEKKGKKKLIVVPKENLETNFALTAWTYLDKFNDFEEQRVTRFIDAHLNQGPEKTME